MASQIRWKRGDYIKLGRAVSDFNKKINELNAVEKKLYLPDLVDYKVAKEEILTRQDLNRMINSLRRFKEEGAEELYVTQAGEKMTKWERKELGIASRVAQRRLQAELKELQAQEQTKYMGSGRTSAIKGSIAKLKQIETKKGKEYKEYIKQMGKASYNFSRLEKFRETTLYNLKILSQTNEEFQPVYDYLKKVTNPEDFYDNFKDNEALNDFYVWYKSPESYAGFNESQELADYILNKFKMNE